MCGKGNRDEPLYHLAGMIRRFSKHQDFTRSKGNLDQKEDPT